MEQTGATRGKSAMLKKPNLRATLKAFKEKKTDKNDERLYVLTCTHKSASLHVRVAYSCFISVYDNVLSLFSQRPTI